MFFSMRWHYTTTFRCVAVIFGFFPKRIKPMISWQPLLLLFFLCFSFSLFLLKTGRKRMMTMFWSGEKARKKSLFIILGYFIWGFRLSQATVLMKSKLMATSLTNSPAKFLRKKKMHEWRNDAIPAENKNLKSAKTTEKPIFTSNKNKKDNFLDPNQVQFILLRILLKRYEISEKKRRGHAVLSVNP